MTGGGRESSYCADVEEKQAYVARRGSNVQNRRTAHHFLNVVSYDRNNAKDENQSRLGVEGSNKHYRSHHRGSSNKCLVCRFLINSKNEKKLKPSSSFLSNEDVKPVSAATTRRSYLLSMKAVGDDDIAASRPARSRDSNDSESQMIRLREKFSASVRPTDSAAADRPRIKLNLWLAWNVKIKSKINFTFCYKAIYCFFLFKNLNKM